MSDGIAEVIGGLLGSGLGAQLVEQGVDRLGTIGDRAAKLMAGVDDEGNAIFDSEGNRLGLASELDRRLEFQPYTVTTPTGGKFGMSVDPDTGQRIFKSELSENERLLQEAQLARAESLFGLATQDMSKREQQVYDRLRELSRPEEERARQALQENLFNQGRLGVRTAMFGGTPEQLALEKAREEAKARTELAAMQYVAEERDRAAAMGSGMLASGYIPQAQLTGAFAPGMTASERARQALAQQTGAYGETYASGLDALLASGIGQADLIGKLGAGVAETALSGLFAGLGKI